jgi:hypothetical protein
MLLQVATASTVAAANLNAFKVVTSSRDLALPASSVTFSLARV